MTSDERQRRREGSRRAQTARERRAEARGRQRSRAGVLYGIGGIVLVGAVIATVLVLRGGGPELGEAVPQLRGLHEPPYVYDQDILIDGAPARIPPTSGNHFGTTTLPWGFLGEPLVPELVVHNMEHGGVVVWYQPGSPDLAGAVNRLVRELGRQCIVAGSYDDMSFAVAATVWGRVLPLEAFDAVQLTAFIDRYRGSQGPEAGLCRFES